MQDMARVQSQRLESWIPQLLVAESSASLAFAWRSGTSPHLQKPCFHKSAESNQSTMFILANNTKGLKFQALRNENGRQAAFLSFHAFFARRCVFLNLFCGIRHRARAPSRSAVGESIENRKRLLFSIANTRQAGRQARQTGSLVKTECFHVFSIPDVDGI